MRFRVRTPSEVDNLIPVALARLQLATAARVHEIFGDYQRWLVGVIRRTAQPDGAIDVIALQNFDMQIALRWRACVGQYRELLDAALEQAAGIPYGALAHWHNYYVASVTGDADAGELTEAQTVNIKPSDIPAGLKDVVRQFQYRRQAALNATRTRIYSDQLVLSRRIWRLENDGLAEIQGRLFQAMSDRTSAAKLADQMESLLGANQNLPRWAYSRLYKMTPTERMRDKSGLLKSPDSVGKGLAYNALRLARTELTYAMHAVHTDISKNAPWVTGRHVVLSPAHPKSDICDAYAAGGPYGPSEEILPLHPQCMCYYKQARMKRSETDRLIRDWLDGKNDFLDPYERFLGRRYTGYIPPNLSNTEALELWLSTGQDSHAIALRATKKSVKLAKAAKVAPPAPAPQAQPQTPAVDLSGPEVVFDKTPQQGLTLNGIDLAHVGPEDWAKLPDQGFPEPAFDSKGKRAAAGVVVVEPDGRVWIVEPTNHYGGYEHTWAKGGVENGLTMQQAAIREAYEELGLRVRLKDFLIDAEGSTSVTRYYVAERIGGAPWDAHWETDKVKLVAPSLAKQRFNVQRDRDVLEQFLEYRYNGWRYQPPQAPQPAAPASNTPAVWAKSKPSGFPDDPDALQVVRRLGGSTGAELVQDADGNLFVRKRGNNAGHLREEAYADAAYQALGANVPEFMLYETANGPVKLSAFLEGGQTLSDLRRFDPAAYRNALEQLRRELPADAVMGNWDVIGASEDNIMVTPDGKIWRIDNGGSFRYRAQGQLKSTLGNFWHDYPLDWWSMRERTSQYRGVKLEDTYGTIATLEQRRDQIVAALPAELQDTVRARIDNMISIATATRDMHADQWKPEYVDRFNRERMELGAAGVFERMTDKLVQPTPKDPNRTVKMEDRNGKPFDHLRGQDSVVKRAADYMRGKGGDWAIVAEWMEQQGIESWNQAPLAMKYWFATQRAADLGNYYWGGHMGRSQQKGEEFLQEQYRKYGQDKYEATGTTFHALSYEVLRRVEFRFNDHAKREVKLRRTEDKRVMEMYGLKNEGQTGKLLRGPLESAGIYRRVTVKGDELTLQYVPWHRIFGMYFLERNPESDYSPFLGDGENEFLIMGDGLDVTYEQRSTFGPDRKVVLETRSREMAGTRNGGRIPVRDVRMDGPDGLRIALFN